MGGLVLQWNWVHRIIQSRCTRRLYCIIPVNLTDKNTPKLLFISFIHLHYLKFEPRLVVAGKNIDKCWKLGWATDHSLSILWCTTNIMHHQILFIYRFVVAVCMTHQIPSDQWVMHSHAQLPNPTPTLHSDFWGSSFWFSQNKTL